MVNNISNMNPIEFNSFIKRLKQQYKQKAVEQKRQTAVPEGTVQHVIECTYYPLTEKVIV